MWHHLSDYQHDMPYKSKIGNRDSLFGLTGKACFSAWLSIMTDKILNDNSRNHLSTADKASAIALFSGGLDSILAVKWMQKLGYRIHPVFFSAPYLPARKAIASAEANGIDLIIRDITPEHLNMIQNPKHGFGKHHNPCVDCHALMFEIAGSMLTELGADFLISGEVLGQRPMSQRRSALQCVANTSGFGDLLIRPLSQKLLPDTRPILEGWVNKEELLAIHGRGRNAQMELAERLGVKDFPAPGGGCLLTDRNYTLRIRDLIAHGDDTAYDIELLRWGRHFRLSPTLKLIVGRDEVDNNELEAVAGPADKMLVRDVMGPLGVLIGEIPDEETLHLAASILLAYRNKASSPGYVRYKIDSPDELEILAGKADFDTLKKYRISYD